MSAPVPGPPTGPAAHTSTPSHPAPTTTATARRQRPHGPPGSTEGSAGGPGEHRPRSSRRIRVTGADLSASITVFLIAIPMSLGLAVAMGAPLGAALLSAGIGGIVAGALGGSPLLVSGPSAGLTVVTAGMIQQFGWQTTCVITIGAGLLQILLGALKAARSALAVSPAIVHGTLAGIGVAIAFAQLHVVLGGSPQSSALANIVALPGQLAHVGLASPLIGALTLAVLILWPRLPGRARRTVGRAPAALVSVGVATAVAAFTAPDIARVDLPSWSAHVLPGMPSGPLLPLLTAVLTMTLVASLESLLSAVAVDKLAAARATAGAGVPGARRAPRTPRPDLDRELRAQGVANALAGVLGGLAVSGGAVRGSANVRAGATSRASTVLHGVWVLLAAGLLVSTLERIPLAALAALVMMVGVQMVSYAHIRNVHRHREFLVYVATVASVILFGVLQGVAIGGAVAVAVALRGLTRTRITMETLGARYHVRVRGQLTFLAVPRLTRVLHQVPQHADCVVELDGSFMDHAAYEVLHEWQAAHVAHGGGAEFTGRAGGRFADPAREASSCCRPWTPWRNHHCDEPAAPVAVIPGAGRTARPRWRLTALPARRSAWRRHGERPGSRHPHVPEDATGNEHRHEHEHNRVGRKKRGGPVGQDIQERGPAEMKGGGTAGEGTAASRGSAKERELDRPDMRESAGVRATTASGGSRLASGLSSFQRNTAPLVRDELARLAREGQRPSQLFLTCSDSRLVTSMITASGPGDLFTVRNVGNLVPLPGTDGGDDSVAAAIEYAVDVLRVESITVCGHSGCGAMHALLDDDAGVDAGVGADVGDANATDGAESSTPLRRWLRHGLPSLRRMREHGGPVARLSARPTADALEDLCLSNIVQQLDNLRAHTSVARRIAEGALTLHGMYFHVGEAQAYLLDESGTGEEREGETATGAETEPEHETQASADARAGTGTQGSADARAGTGTWAGAGTGTQGSVVAGGAENAGLPAYDPRGSAQESHGRRTGGPRTAGQRAAPVAVFHRVAAAEPAGSRA
jgi:carbonic anhydrase